MSSLDERVAALEHQLAQLTIQLQALQNTLLLVGDVQRYSRLRDLLAAGDLDAADRETASLLFDGLADQYGDVSPEALERCPAAMLQIIDGLWSTSSHGGQGFSVQQRLYRELGGSRESLISQDLALFARFTQAVAWPTLAGVGFVLPDELTVPVSAALDDDALPPRGHLPLRCWGSDYGLKGANLLMARLIEVFAA
ncbi:GUN4 domain-containing protein [Synechococcus sp. CCY 0621]|uniref:GUN4 domain-containing protein n=1 Tax=Synechococcus sp. CCY 0621 TaxID=2815603 RepID=UPI001C251327|nr:GUN4 domain-containing protein [Synechococcus sp. CCY 0621]